MTTTSKTNQTSKTTTKSGSSRFSAEERAAMKARAAEVRATFTLVTESAPELAPRTWYGMPAYGRDGKVVCYFKAAAKFKSRYAQFGFEDAATLDDGTVWPTVFAITDLTEADERTLTRLVKKAARAAG